MVKIPLLAELEHAHTVVPVHDRVIKLMSASVKLDMLREHGKLNASEEEAAVKDLQAKTRELQRAKMELTPKEVYWTLGPAHKFQLENLEDAIENFDLAQ